MHCLLTSSTNSIWSKSPSPVTWLMAPGSWQEPPNHLFITYVSLLSAETLLNLTIRPPHPADRRGWTQQHLPRHQGCLHPLLSAHHWGLGRSRREETTSQDAAAILEDHSLGSKALSKKEGGSYGRRSRE